MSHETSPGWSVFTKPWPRESVPQLGALVREMGFDGVELPIRPGFQVEPATVAAGLPRAVSQLAELGIAVSSVAAPTDDATFSACAASGVPLIRIMVPFAAGGYWATDSAIRRTLDELVGRSEKFGVRVGIQPHYDDFISDSTSLYGLLKEYDPKHIGAIWDSAHEALARKAPEHGLELLWPWLVMVNFKNAFYERREVIGAPASHNGWEPHFTGGPAGMADWQSAIRYLVARGYGGGLCLTAEYTDESGLVGKVSDDLEYARTLWQEAIE